MSNFVNEKSRNFRAKLLYYLNKSGILILSMALGNGRKGGQNGKGGKRKQGSGKNNR